MNIRNFNPLWIGFGFGLVFGSFLINSVVLLWIATLITLATPYDYGYPISRGYAS